MQKSTQNAVRLFGLALVSGFLAFGCAYFGLWIGVALVAVGCAVVLRPATILPLKMGGIKMAFRGGMSTGPGKSDDWSWHAPWESIAGIDCTERPHPWRFVVKVLGEDGSAVDMTLSGMYEWCPDLSVIDDSDGTPRFPNLDETAIPGGMDNTLRSNIAEVYAPLPLKAALDKSAAEVVVACGMRLPELPIQTLLAMSEADRAAAISKYKFTALPDDPVERHKWYAQNRDAVLGPWMKDHAKLRGGIEHHYGVDVVRLVIEPPEMTQSMTDVMEGVAVAEKLRDQMGKFMRPPFNLSAQAALMAAVGALKIELPKGFIFMGGSGSGSDAATTGAAAAAVVAAMKKGEGS